MKKLYGKFLLILIPLIGALVILYPTYKAADLETLNTAAKLEANEAKEAGDYEKSLEIMDDFKAEYGEALADARSKRLKLGLDLRGGMYVTLEIDIIKLIEESSIREERDELLTEVLTAAKKELDDSDDPVLDVFLRNFKTIAGAQGKTLINYFDFGELKDVSEDKIIEHLQTNIDGAIDQAHEVIRQRVDKYGVSEPNIQKQGNRRILLELPGVKNEIEMRQLLSTTARLEFNMVRNNQKIVKAFYKIDMLLAEKAKRKEAIEKDTKPVVSEESATTTEEASSTATADPENPYEGMDDDAAAKQFMADHPFTTLFSTRYLGVSMRDEDKSQPQNIQYINENLPEGEYSFMISEDALEKFEAILARPDVKSLIPIDYKIVREAKDNSFYKKETGTTVYDFHCLKAEPELTGDVVTSAMATFDQQNQPIVTMGMNSDGAERWGRITGANVHKRVSVVLDDMVYTAPTIQDKISGGNTQITGMADIDEARLLEIVLKAGALKAPVQIIEERVIGPSLGEDSIMSGRNASLFAFGIVILYMLFYYNKGGFVANIALLLNVLLILALLASFHGTLTLPGIAGIILTIGMAVDANVLIFERIREELHRGRSIRSAIDEGYSKALSAIIDSNITTGITASILYFLGTGPIQGFALTLLIGIFCTLFTAILVTRAIVEVTMGAGAKTYNFGQPAVKHS
ncbi:MAG: protein translocase subunit SecD [Candidatus Kapabacteria bacterium]|nr:protein translocase subunit SecD [Candidatus Kapabacteria bacterium]